MKVRVLGPVAVEIDGVVATPGTPRERAVLAQLALAAGRPVSRSELIDLLWGDDHPQSAVKTVQAYVSRLRQSADVTIESTGASYTLQLPGSDVDANAFADLNRQAAERSAAHPSEAVALWDEALSLWRGRPFPELPDSLAAQAIATNLEEQMLAAREGRLDALTACGDTSRAIGDAMLLCRSHPMRERAWAALMLALYLSGRQAEALRTYQLIRSRLAEEVGIEPGPELVDLAARIASQDPTLGTPAAKSDRGDGAHGDAPPATPGPSALLAGPQGPSPHLAGRRDELDAIDRWQRTVTPVLIIEGEPGIGKTALMERWRHDATAGTIALVAKTSEGLVAGLGTIAELARALLGRVDEPTARELAQDDPVALALLAPSLARVLGDPGHVSSELFGHRIPGAFVSLLERAAQAAPVILFIDDIQWCSAASLAVLRQALRGDARIRIVATARSVDAGDDTDWRRSRIELEREVAVDTLQLGGLDEHALESFSPSGMRLEPELARQLAVRSGGHPLLTSALLDELEESGTLRAERGELVHDGDLVQAALPTAVRQMVDRRVAAFGDRLALLERVAVLAHDVDEDLCVDVLGIDADELLDLMDAAVDAQLAEVTDAGTFRFRHDLVRSALAARAGSRRAQRLHRRAFETLGGRAQGADLIRSIDHGLQGRIDPSTLAAAASRAAERAAELFVPSDEVALRRIAVEQLTQADAPTDERLRAEIALGVAMIRDADGDAAAQRASTIALARAIGDPVGLAEAAVRIGIDYSLGPTTERIDELTEALAGLSQIDGHDDLAIEVQAALAAQLWAQGNDERRRDLITQALSSTQGRRALTRCRVLSSATWALPGVASLDERGQTAAELVQIATEFELPFEIATGLNDGAAARFGVGDLAGGTALAAELTELRRRYRLPVLHVIDISLRAGIAILHGRLDDAWEMIHQAIAMADDEGVAAVGLGPVGRPIIELAADRGDVARIPAHLFEFGDMLDTYPPYRMSKLYARVFLGDPSAADDIPIEIAGLASLPSDIGHLFAANRLASVVDLADADVGTDPIRQVLLRYRDLVDWSGSASSGPASLWLAVLARRKGDVEDALTWLAQAERLADALEAPLWRARILRERALLARRGGPLAEGAAERARAIAGEAGAHLITRLLDRDGL